MCLHICVWVCDGLSPHPSLAQGGEETTWSPESRGQVQTYSTPTGPPLQHPHPLFSLPLALSPSPRHRDGWVAGVGWVLGKLNGMGEEKS